jgi:phosphoenolpyruvate carboxylase
MESLERDRAELNVQAVPQWRDQPYRRKLGLVAERLRRTESAGSGGYTSADDLLADLRLISTSLHANGGQRIAAGGLLDLQRRVEAFGFSLAELEIRQHADKHAAAVAELLGVAGLPSYLGMPEPERMRVLEEQLMDESPLAIPAEALSPAMCSVSTGRPARRRALSR